MLKDKILFRYRPLLTETDVQRAVDILENYRLYSVPINKLNDPLEGLSVQPNFNPAVNNEYGIIDKADPIMRDLLNKYRIISLCNNCMLHPMWAHYGDNYNGICIGFWRESNIAKQAHKVEYAGDVITDEHIAKDTTLGEMVMQALCRKHSDWSYEQEWRLILYGDENSYFKINIEDIACIVVGSSNINKEFLDFIINKFYGKIPILKVITSVIDYRLKLVPIRYELQTEGMPMIAMGNMDELVGYLYAKTRFKDYQ